MATARRVTVIAHELRGFRPVGGMGTATTFLALALARQGHAIEILLGKHPLASLDPYWAGVYREAEIEFRQAPAGAEPVEPWHFDYPRRVELGLRETTPDVVIAHDFGAPAYVALRLRQAGLAFEETMFVVFCHGPRRYVVDLSPTLPLGDLQTVLAVGVLEQAAVELADVVVSPSAYLLDWMRERGWKLPAQSRVIPYFTPGWALGEPVQAAGRHDSEPLRRLVFFGRIDEKKGLKILAGALNALEPERLRGVELEFVGRPTNTWTRERAAGLLSDRTARALANVRFETELDQPQALARLRRPGTLVVMPSLQENSPNTVYESLEHGIPFIASNVGGVPELITPADHERVLFEPNVGSLAETLDAILADGQVPPPAGAAFEPSTAASRWADVLDLRPPRAAVHEPDAAELEAVASGSSPFVVVLDEGDRPDPGLVETLLRAQHATKADVVTCGIRVDGTLRFFPGDAGGLGALENTYGTAGLVRRSLLADLTEPVPSPRDRAWPLFARLAASGARIVSVPAAIMERQEPPGSAQDDPVGALLALQELEAALPDALKGAARLAAGLTVG
jgi:glycosyltransferase involved in cell wall biosynthesis